MADQQQQFASGSSNTTTVLETLAYDCSWRPCTEFPEFLEQDPLDCGHELRSSIVWLYQPAHESKNHDNSTTVWPGHVYLGMCIKPLVKTADGYDYGEPYFIDIGRRSICAVTMWRHLDTPIFPYDELEAKGRVEGTSFNPEFHKGNVIGDKGTPSNFA